MKTALQVILVILFVPIFLIFLLTLTFKYQVLEPSFWRNSFEKHDVYTKLSNSLQDSLERETKKGGGDIGISKILTGLLTPENLKDFLDRNFENFLNYANGKVKDAIVYIPFSKIPKELIPRNLNRLNEEMPLKTFLANFQGGGTGGFPVEQVPGFVKNATAVMIVSGILSLIILFFLFKNVGKGKRFIAPGAAFIASGVITVLIAFLAGVASKNIAVGFNVPGNLPKIIISIISPPVLTEISKTWMYFGVGIVVLGIIPIFLKKRIA